MIKAAALLALADAAEALARLARAVAEETSSNPEDLVSVRDAARFAATSPRIVRDAIRLGDLPAYGGQRDRSVRRRDLGQWIECGGFLCDWDLTTLTSSGAWRALSARGAEAAGGEDPSEDGHLVQVLQRRKGATSATRYHLNRVCDARHPGPPLPRTADPQSSFGA